MIRFIFTLLLLLPLSFSSCSKNEDVIEVPSSTSSSVDISIYKEIVIENVNLLTEWALEKKGVQDGMLRSSKVEHEKFQKLQEKLLPSAIKFSEELGLSVADMESVFGVKFHTRKDYEEAALGIMLFTTLTNEYLNLQKLRGGSLKDCFIEATGIAAGAALVGGLASGTIGKEAIKLATTKILTKVGVRAISGIGLALLVAEIAWCMY